MQSSNLLLNLAKTRYLAPDFVRCNPQDSHVRSVRYDPCGFFFRVIHLNIAFLGNASLLGKCEHVKNMSPFLTCFPHLLSAKPFGWGHTRLSHIKRRRLIMPLVALVQKKITAHPQLRTNSGARRSLPRRRCSSRSVFEQVSAFIYFCLCFSHYSTQCTPYYRAEEGAEQ